MTLLQTTINNIKEVLITGELILERLEKAQKEMGKSPLHKWEHGDVFKNRWGVTMIYIRRFSKIQIFCVPGPCDTEHPSEEVLPQAKFLFNIREKL